jgi:hypothetical protein
VVLTIIPMKTSLFVAGRVALGLFATCSLALAQTARFDSKPGSLKIRIEGTSTIHDWQMESSLIGGFLEVGPGFPAEPGQEVKPGPIQAKVQVFVPVRSLKSLEKDGKPYSDKMDEIVYEKLKEPTNRRILFTLKELVLKSAPASKDAPYVFDSKGELVVAGVTNTISMPVNVTPQGNKTIKLTGNVTLKMSDYKIEPPSPTGLGMLIKTGDEVKLYFEWTVRQKPAPAPAAAAASK